MINWENLTTDAIIGGKTPEGVRYLEMFLKDYSQLTGTTNLCATCNSLIESYHKKYIQKMGHENQNTQYRLYSQYEGVQLEPCSSIMVNNANLTNEYAEILIKQGRGNLFSKIPTKPKTVVAIEVITEPIVEPTIAEEPKGKRTKGQ